MARGTPSLTNGRLWTGDGGAQVQDLTSASRRWPACNAGSGSLLAVGTRSYRFGHVLAPYGYKLGVVDILAAPTQLLDAVTEASETVNDLLEHRRLRFQPRCPSIRGGSTVARDAFRRTGHPACCPAIFEQRQRRRATLPVGALALGCRIPYE
jgi:hypothetical protein